MPKNAGGSNMNMTPAPLAYALLRVRSGLAQGRRLRATILSRAYASNDKTKSARSAQKSQL